MWKIARIYEAKFLLFFLQIEVVIVIMIFTQVVFLRKWRHFLQFSAKTWNKEN